MSISGVEILRVGRWNGREYAGRDLDAIVESYAALAPVYYEAPGKLGHNDDQTLTDGQPAVGWVTRVYRKGNSLLADFKDVPATLGRLIQAGGYRKRSVEVMFNVQMAERTWDCVLKAVAWLGADMPAVKGMSDVMEFYTDQDGHQVFVADLVVEQAALIDASFEDIRRCVQECIEERYPWLWDYTTGTLLPGADPASPSPSIRDMYADRAIVWDQEVDDLWAIPYSITEGVCTLGEPYPVAVQYEAIPPSGEAMMSDAVPTKSSILAQFQTAYEALESAGKGAKGITSLRAFLKSAMKQLKDLNIADDEAQNADTTPATSATSSTPEGTKMPFTEDDLRTLLNLSADVDEAGIRAHLVGLTASGAQLADVQAMRSELQGLTERLADRDAEDAVNAAISTGKILPRMKEWGKTLFLKDKASFEAYTEAAPVLVETKETGSGSGAGDGEPAAGSQAELTQAEREVAAIMGTPLDKLADRRPLAEKRAEMAAKAARN